MRLQLIHVKVSSVVIIGLGLGTL